MSEIQTRIVFDDAAVTQEPVKVTDVKPGDVIVYANKLWAITEPPEVVRDRSGRYIQLMSTAGIVVQIRQSAELMRVSAEAAFHWERLARQAARPCTS